MNRGTKALEIPRSPWGRPLIPGRPAPPGCVRRVVASCPLTSMSRGNIAPPMVTVEEQRRKPLCLDSDLGDGHHLPEYALHARSERVQHIRRGTVLPDDRAVQKRVHAKMRGARTDQPPPHQVPHQGVVDLAIV